VRVRLAAKATANLFEPLTACAFSLSAIPTIWGL